MRKKRLIFLFTNCVTVLFLLSITGCDETLHSNPDIRERQVPELPDISTPNLDTTNPSWYVSWFGRDADDNPGTDPAKPLASVQTALDRIKSEYKSGQWQKGSSAVIMIYGTIYGPNFFGPNNAMFDISEAGSYPPIILERDANSGTLHARRNQNNEGRILYIANNKVTLGNKLTLTGGYAFQGGAVFVGASDSSSEGEFVMAGGEIVGNIAGFGGGVWIHKGKGKMTMTGGTIRNNATTRHNNMIGSGGGVYVNTSASFTMSNGNIRNNGGTETDKGGGVFVNGKGLFTMSGGEIRFNTSVSQGGGSAGKFLRYIYHV
jgi:hypothetical protein